MRSIEFIKGYTEIIVLSLLDEGEDYVYSIVKKINDKTNSIIQITNPSILMVMKKLLEEGKVITYTAASDKSANKRYYLLTDEGRQYCKENCKLYLESLDMLKKLIDGGRNEKQNSVVRSDIDERISNA